MLSRSRSRLAGQTNPGPEEPEGPFSLPPSAVCTSKSLLACPRVSPEKQKIHKGDRVPSREKSPFGQPAGGSFPWDLGRAGTRVSVASPLQSRPRAFPDPMEPAPTSDPTRSPAYSKALKLTLQVKGKVKLQNQLHNYFLCSSGRPWHLGRAPVQRAPSPVTLPNVYFSSSISGGIQLSVEQLDHQGRKNRVG